MRSLASALVLAVGVLSAGCSAEDDATGGIARPEVSLAPAAACPPPEATGAGAGARLPDVSLPCLGQAGTLNLRDLPAQPMVLNLWASWCVPCREEMPALERVSAAARGQVLFLGINTRDGTKAARSFVQDFGVTYANLSDPAGTALNLLGGRGLPLTLVLGADGAVLDRTIGGIDEDELARVLGRAGVTLDRARLNGHGTR